MCGNCERTFYDCYLIFFFHHYKKKTEPTVTVRCECAFVCACGASGLIWLFCSISFRFDSSRLFRYWFVFCFVFCYTLSIYQHFSIHCRFFLLSEAYFFATAYFIYNSRFLLLAHCPRSWRHNTVNSLTRTAFERHSRVIINNNTEMKTDKKNELAVLQYNNAHMIRR